MLADGTDFGQCLAGGVGQRPIEAALTRVDRAGVSAAHGDDHIGATNPVLGQRLGGCAERSRPISVMAVITAGLIYWAGAEPAERTCTRAVAW